MKKNGFSLIELMTVIIIIGIMAGLTVPGIMKNIPHRKQKDARSQLFGELHLIRQMAMGKDVFYCLDVISSTQYRVFVDNSLSPNGLYDGGETILRTVQLPSGITFSNTTFSVGFRPTGVLINNTINALAIQNTVGSRDTIYIMQSGSIF
ncbi:MAG: type II secretion system GspH family protein [Candidatus Edwardsbacteria bacterium]|nr:type II secretion system GspH family protein [Candidatus Edwardsbacteria bacterium]MBU1577549.1 type II secretion system GspH family protein [Candidatus Edwardsbacteria bacterium]MBU2462513.1 type II secretion system GspH family protein [Candidatus Edwardsbacteria bacterium]MBU2593644.1 type II secretion system GspH family protein [Candidatus Edwardsbacteria bacterium]